MTNRQGQDGMINVLYVDDSVFDRELVRDALEREHGGFRVVEASSRDEFESRLAEGEYDVVLTDLEIRGFNGHDVIEMVRDKDINLPVVVVTSTGSEQGAVGAMKRGAADYVIKSSDQILRLPEIILVALERRRLQEAHLRQEDAQRFLAQASGVLASSLDYEATLKRLVHLAVPGMADFCAIQIADEKSMGGVMMASLDPGGEEIAYESWRPWHASSGGQETLKAVLRSEAPQLLPEIPESLLPVIAESTAQLGMLRKLEFSSVIVAPVVARLRLIGLLLIGRFGPEKEYGSEDLMLAGELASRVALAVDNARLYRDARDAIRARDEFLAMASHELKTPITSLKGFAQLTLRLLDKGGTPDLSQIREAMEVINKQSDKLNNLMQQLLDVSRIESRRMALDLKACDLVAITRETVEKVAMNSGGRTITLSGPSSVPVLVDGIRLEQVLTNLLENAVKFSSDDKSIEVELEVPSADTVQLSVRDHGVGIPAERLDRIFDRFYQAHGEGAHGGMGLGLYICKHIVDMHGGAIRVECPEDGGTRFSVTLPIGVAADSSGGASQEGLTTAQVA